MKDNRKLFRIVAGACGVAVILIAGMAVYSFWPRNLAEVRSLANSRGTSTVAEPPDAKSGYVRLRQLVYYRTNQPVGTIVVDKSQTFLYVIRPNVSALRYSIGVGTECSALAGLYHVARKEELPRVNEANRAGNSLDRTTNLLGARVLYLDKGDYRIHGFDESSGLSLPEGCIRLVNNDVIYLYDHTPLESRVVVSN